MSSSTLSSRQLVRLARRSQLSLTLRAEWQRIVSGEDPLNSLRHRVLFLNLLILSAISFAVGGGATLALSHLHRAEYVQLAKTISANSLISGAILVFTILTLDVFGWDGREGLRFKKEFCNFLSWGYPGQKMSDVVESLAQATLEDFKAAAKNILIGVAEKILEHDANKRDDLLVAPDWSKRKSLLDQEIQLKYVTLEHFGLVHGGYDFFFAEAKKRLAEEKAKEAGAEATAAA